MIGPVGRVGLVGQTRTASKGTRSQENAKGGTEPVRAADQAEKLFPHSQNITFMKCLT